MHGISGAVEMLHNVLWAILVDQFGSSYLSRNRPGARIWYVNVPGLPHAHGFG